MAKYRLTTGKARGLRSLALQGIETTGHRGPYYGDLAMAPFWPYLPGCLCALGIVSLIINNLLLGALFN